MAWTEEYKQRRIAKQLDRIMQEEQVSLDHAIQIRLNRLRAYASKGGKKGGGKGGFKDRELASRAGKISGRVRNGKNSL